MKKKRKRTRRSDDDRRQKKKERASSPTLIFFERGDFVGKLSKNLREFCVLFWGGCQTSKSKKNNRSPKQRPPALAGGVGNLYEQFFIHIERHITSSPSSTSSNGRDELHVLHGVAEQQRSLEDDLV